MNDLVTIAIKIHSGVPNPEWTLPPNVAESLLQALDALPPVSLWESLVISPPQGKPGDPLGRPRSGYRGFEVHVGPALLTQPTFEVFGQLVLESATGEVRTEPEHAISWEARIFNTAPDEVRLLLDGLTLEELTAPCHEDYLIQNINGPAVGLACTQAPLFLGDSDQFNRFLRVNNCYNYATNVINKTANPSAVPGPDNRKQKFSIAELRGALADDHLELVGMQLPSVCPPHGAHYVAALVRYLKGHRLEDFHFLRMDRKGRWSHKDGVDAVTNSDDKGFLLTDPTRARFCMPSELAGIYLVFDQYHGFIK